MAKSTKRNTKRKEREQLEEKRKRKNAGAYCETLPVGKAKLYTHTHYIILTLLTHIYNYIIKIRRTV